MSFVHLYTHSEYSIGRSIIKIKDMIDKAINSDMKAIALTDENMFGAMEFYKLAKSKGIKPIFGFEGYVSLTSRFDKDIDVNYPIVLLAKNEKGYKNLMKLSTFSYTEGFCCKPRIDKNLLREYSDGIIAGSVCLNSEVQFNLLNGNYDTAKRAVMEYKEIFGKENFFLGIAKHGLDEEKIIEDNLIKLANETDTILVAINDCRYLNKTDVTAYEVFLSIQTDNKIKTENIRSHELYFKTEEEMLVAFEDHPEFVRNSQLIADMCDGIELDNMHFAQQKRIDGIEHLKKLAYEGLKRKTAELGESEKRIYKERLDFELNIIEQANIAEHILIALDIVNYAKANDVLIEATDSNSAGSLVLYCIGINHIDPIKHGLVFEKALNPESMIVPEISFDFSCDIRDEILNYAKEKYGSYNVAYIPKFLSISTKGSIRSVGKALGFSEDEIDKIIKMIPDCYNIEQSIKNNPELREKIESSDKIKRLFDISETLEGVKKGIHTFPFDTVISEDPIYEYCPLYKLSDKEIYLTQFSSEYLKDVGLGRFFLSKLKALSVIKDTVKLIGDDFDIYEIPLDDKETYELLQKGDTLGVFQLESQGMQRLIKDLKPTCFEDLIALVALYRPMPLKSGMVNDFIDRKHGKKKIEYPLPELEHILKETYGMILYQEQIMQIANKLARYTLEEANILRESMCKKKKEVIEEQQAVFVERSVKNGISKEKAEYIFDLMAKFAEYSFDKSHAVTYAYITYQTAYLKTHYKGYFLYAAVANETNVERVQRYMEAVYH